VVDDRKVVGCDIYNLTITGDKVCSLTAEGHNSTGSCPKVMVPATSEPAKPYYIVRRLTPTECERLQGYPDGWTDIGDWVDTKGKKHKATDSPRYKALGNSIALPVWKIILKRLCACYERDATMASLFDGIGGFPYLWEQINGNGSCLWASEIEEFPMEVTRKRINKE
jgi:DNA (cytosine-5)-methyltransferase 1